MPLLAIATADTSAKTTYLLIDCLKIKTGLLCRFISHL
ncbi:hypothetical protein RNAN_2905 [Rheinheimera nanhaiensis E407-8]|uniref:Uncharacterized protein n=1 Tax=Rheinheimera nanhaiensis E407-8 TaxID=562729 RepID=I1E0R4_9GAMM|nr:hypothetical protein RNAN_2905 [Rheinheimera nanhaiensis E407-8]